MRVVEGDLSGQELRAAPLPYKHLFPRASEVAYLDTAAEGLPAPGCAEAFQRYVCDKSQGTPGQREFYRAEAEARELAAQLLATAPENVTFLSCASEAVCALAGAIDWKPGDEVLISDGEFPSNVVPWLRLREQGVRLVVLPAGKTGLTWEAVAERLTPATRAVSLSLVSYKTGAYLPALPKLAAETKRAGVVLAIDATQALGRCPVPLEGVDYLMASCFKWQLAPHGLAVVYVSPGFRKRLHPTNGGWYSAMRLPAGDHLERYDLKPGAACLATGMPNFISLYGLRQSLGFLLGAGVTRLDEALRPTVGHLHHGLKQLGCDLLTPDGPEFASGIVAFAHKQALQIGAALERSGVVVRAVDGRVRASVHLYNDAHDIERYLDALRSILEVEGRLP